MPMQILVLPLILMITIIKIIIWITKNNMKNRQSKKKSELSQLNKERKSIRKIKNDKRKREEKHMTTPRINHNSSTSAVEKVMKSAPTCTTGSVEPVSGRRTVSSIHRADASEDNAKCWLYPLFALNTRGSGGRKSFYLPALWFIVPHSRFTLAEALYQVFMELCLLLI